MNEQATEREKEKERIKRYSSHLNDTVFLQQQQQHGHSKWFFAVEILCVFITRSLCCAVVVFVVCSSPLLFTLHTIFYCAFVSNVGHRAHTRTQIHHIHNFVRNQICRLCTPTWIQIIRAGQWGSGCRIAFYSTMPSIQCVCFFLLFLSLGRFLFVLLNLFGFRWMLFVTLLLLSNQTQIQRDCSHWALNGDGFLLFVRVSEWVCHIWAVSRQ